MSLDDLKIGWSTARELLSFVWESRYWWLTPVVVLLLIMSGLVIFLESSVIAPLIYVLF